MAVTRAIAEKMFKESGLEGEHLQNVVDHYMASINKEVAAVSSAKDQEIEQLKETLNTTDQQSQESIQQAKKLANDLEKMKNQYEADKKNLLITNNRMKAAQEFNSLNIDSEKLNGILDTLVTEDESATIESAKLIANTMSESINAVAAKANEDRINSTIIPGSITSLPNPQDGGKPETIQNLSDKGYTDDQLILMALDQANPNGSGVMRQPGE